MANQWPGGRASTALSLLVLTTYASTEAWSRVEDRSGEQRASTQFGGAYAGLDSRRQRLVDDWVY